MFVAREVARVKGCGAKVDARHQIQDEYHVHERKGDTADVVQVAKLDQHRKEDEESGGRWEQRVGL